MNFDLSEDQKLLVETVASFVKQKSPVSRMRGLRSDPVGYSPQVWRQMGQFGWLGAAFPEAVGGAGGGLVDAALILEQLGTTLVPEPVLPALVAGWALLRAGSAPQHRRFLAPMLAGESLLALAYAEPQSRHDLHDVETRAERRSGSYRLRGAKRFVLAGHAARAFVVSARSGGAPRARDGVSLFIVDRDTPGVGVQAVATMDGRRAAMLTLDCEVGADALLGQEGDGADALEEAVDVGATGACAEGVGITQTVLQMTLDYLRTREQFGVKIGTFQALQHRAVDMFVETELCKSTAIMASIKVSDHDPVQRQSAVSAAKVQLAVGGRLVTQQAIQLHGGIGITDEHDVGLYFKRMHILNSLYGDEEHHLARFAALPSFLDGVPAP
ncbi:MAG TPA: acyl-CoA dehydrogenase family protein [Polyangia bacterium]|nr:acyl-CoA dehydrogenase family protein [Polyangia bacterium]